MDAPPVSLPPERCWTEEKERALIGFFSKHSCLWNHKSESYKNRQLRWRTLERLRVLLSAQPPPVQFTVEDIKNKFKNLRTTFQRQYKMVKASQVCRAEDVFAPQWKHYQQLMFLQGCWDLDDDPDDPPLSPPAAPREESRAVLASSVTVKCHWTEERERALIAFFSEHGCLWNKRSENHNNRLLRTRLLEALRRQLSDPTVSLSVEDIKCKFKNLRTVFNREYKVVQASRTSHTPYVSKWKHYQQLLFLCESCDEDDRPGNPQTLMPPEDRGLERGNQTASSTLGGFSSSSIQTNGGKFSRPGDAGTDVSATCQAFLSASPGGLKLVSQTAAAASPPALPLDTKPATDHSSPKFSMSGAVLPDSRPTGDSRCYWNEPKVQQLISFYSEHSCLWNHKSENYRNRLLRHSLLETLSSLLSDGEPVPFTVEDIKTKFRNLRTIFQREHRAVSSNKTCGSEDFYFPKWRHYRELMFLCDSCDEDERAEHLDLQDLQEPRGPVGLRLDGQAPPPSQNGAAHATAKPDVTSRSLERPPSPASRRSSPCSSASSTASSCHADCRTSGRKRASGCPPPASSEMLDFIKTLWQSQTVSPHAGFLKYVEECLNETPPDKVKKLKKKIIETIHSVSEEA